MSKWTAAYTPSMGWMVRGCKVMPITSSTGFVCGLSKEDAKLIADAPDLLAEVKRLRETKRWYDCHHTKCEDIHGAECVPSEEEVERFHKTGDWEEEE